MSDSTDDTGVIPLKPIRKKKNEAKQKREKMPLYNIVLWNDDDHSYEYVILMLKSLFGFPVEKGFKLAEKVDKSGFAVLLTTTKEYAEFKQEQIHAHGPDKQIPNCVGAMTATVEPENFA